jgi:hypothetical protein
MDKVFTAILNRRLWIISEEYDILNKNQCGFRSGHSTCDNISILHSLISLYLGCGKNIFVVLSISARHLILFRELVCCKEILDNCIDGKCFRIIWNMYSKIKSNKTRILVFSKRKFGIDSFFCLINTKLQVWEDIFFSLQSYKGIHRNATRDVTTTHMVV